MAYSGRATGADHQVTSELVPHDLCERIDAATRRLEPRVVQTRVVSSRLSDRLFLKLENEQTTGSFKFRGALNRLLVLDDAERQRGCVTASSGNHAAAVAAALATVNAHGQIFVPLDTSPAKLQKIRKLGGEVCQFGNDGLDTELHARAEAARQKMTYISPYNDPDVIAGQATVGVELIAQLPDLDTVYVAIGGGGLISGVAAALKRVRPDIAVVGCQPSASAVMTRSIEAGRIVDIPSDPTLSDGTAGGIEQGAVTFDLCRTLVDRFETVNETDIAAAMRQAFETDGLRIEGAAGVALAVALRDERPGTRAVIVCGGNVSDAVFDRVLGRATATDSGQPQ